MLYFSAVCAGVFSVPAALDYLLHSPLTPVDRDLFEAACGVGVVIRPDQIETAVSSFYLL